MVEQKRAAFETARLQLAKLHVTQADAGFSTALRIAAQALDVERVGIWFFDHPNHRLVCRSMLQRSTNTVVGGDVLPEADAPNYWRALRETRALVADDARNDVRTRDLRDGYLVPLGVTSLLDAPIFQEGEMVGVVCHEHVGPMRKWSQPDIDFAATVADLVASQVEHAQRLAVEQALRIRLIAARDCERLEVVTRIAAAVAHDFRNVFTALGFIAQNLEATNRDIATMLKSSLGIGHFLTSQLDTFAQRPANDAARCDATAVIVQLRPMLELLVRGAAMLKIDLPSEPLWVEVSPGVVEQALLNLVLNARDAVTDDGQIAIVLQGNADRSAHLRVIDNGRGIPLLHLERVFELGFSTRQDGTGIGLSTVRDAMARFGATVSVASPAHGGAEFIVAMPGALAVSHS
ncbi:MAG: GAF domain-containing protein [Kofleriaceae bacterium]|nr:GAF domain-containing protein [Kofleriaceae bacterium]